MRISAAKVNGIEFGCGGGADSYVEGVPSSRTYREEFYDCSDATPTVAGFKAALRDWEHTYNHIRPHQSLGQLTPAQFLATFNANHQQEDLSRTS